MKSYHPGLFPLVLEKSLVWLLGTVALRATIWYLLESSILRSISDAEYLFLLNRTTSFSVQVSVLLRLQHVGQVLFIVIIIVATLYLLLGNLLTSHVV